MAVPVMHPVYRAMNKPLMLCGVQRELFGVAIMLAALVFWASSSVLGAVITFSALFLSARMATRKDPQLPRIWVDSLKMAQVYDSAAK